MKLLSDFVLLLFCFQLATGIVHTEGIPPADGTQNSTADASSKQLIMPSQDISTTGACQLEILDYCGYLLKVVPKQKSSRKKKSQSSESLQPADSKESGESAEGNAATQADSDSHKTPPKPDTTEESKSTAKANNQEQQTSESSTSSTSSARNNNLRERGADGEKTSANKGGAPEGDGKNAEVAKTGAKNALTESEQERLVAKQTAELQEAAKAVGVVKGAEDGGETDGGDAAEGKQEDGSKEENRAKDRDAKDGNVEEESAEDKDNEDKGNGEKDAGDKDNADKENGDKGNGDRDKEDKDTQDKNVEDKDSEDKGAGGEKTTRRALKGEDKGSAGKDTGGEEDDDADLDDITAEVDESEAVREAGLDRQRQSRLQDLINKLPDHAAEAATQRLLLTEDEETIEYRYKVQQEKTQKLELNGPYVGRRLYGHVARIFTLRSEERERVYRVGQKQLLWNPKQLGNADSLVITRKGAHLQRITQKGVELMEKLGVAGFKEGKTLPPSAPIAKCLRRVIRISQTSISPDAPQVSEKCRDELQDYLSMRSTDFSKQVNLWVICAHDLLHRCEKVVVPRTTAAVMLGCLLSHKPTLRDTCKQAITQYQIESAEDISLDPALYARCNADRERLCYDVPWGGGQAKRCLQRYLLRNEPPQLDKTCADALFKRMVQDSENIRFDYYLASVCAADKQAVCPDVPPEDGEAFECLVAQKNSMDVSAPCRSALDEAALLRSMDVRLHWRFRQLCGKEVERLCSDEDLMLLYDQHGPVGKAASLFECMRQQVKNISDGQCGQLVHKILVAGFIDNRLDTVFQQSCAEEAIILCKNSPNQVVCLMERKRAGYDLSARCSVLVMNRLQQAASDIDFNPQLREKCLLERSKFCDNSDITGGAVLDCLVDSRASPGFGAVCRQAVGEYLVAAMSDIRMLHTLREACAEDLRVLCQGVEPGQGKLLMCLQRKRGHIQSTACRVQLLRVVGLQADDHRLHLPLSKACGGDVAQFCSKVAPGGGMIHKCLRKHESALSPECRKYEHELEQAEHEDARVDPAISKACSVASTVFCQDVEPGDARVLTCLRGNMDKPDFPSACKKALRDQLARAAVKFELNKDLREACADDVEDECSDAADEDSSDDERMSCLGKKINTITSECRSQVLSLVKLQLSNYRMGLPLTAACDGDVLSRCQIDKLNMPLLARGYVLACLVKNAGVLHQPCWELISAFDDAQRTHAKELEMRHWNQQLPQGQLEKVVAEVRSSLEPHLTSHMIQHVSGVVQREQASLRPKLRAIFAAVVVLGLGTSALMFYLVRWRKWRGPVVMKDGRA